MHGGGAAVTHARTDRIADATLEPHPEPRALVERRLADAAEWNADAECPALFQRPALAERIPYDIAELSAQQDAYAVAYR
ncbi:MAG: hypothetical protein U0838_05135 [Chloroflexota bacterium]